MNFKQSLKIYFFKFAVKDAQLYSDNTRVNNPVI